MERTHTAIQTNLQGCAAVTLLHQSYMRETSHFLMFPHQINLAQGTHPFTQTRPLLELMTNSISVKSESNKNP